MKRIIFSIFVILSAFVFSVSAQTTAQTAFEKGMSSANGGKFETALSEFQTSLAFAENADASDNFRAKIHFNIGVCFYKLKQNAEAVREFEQAVKLKKGDYEKAFYALGMAQAELKNWDEAEKAFRGAIGSNKQNGEAWFDLAFVYLAQENYELAQTAFQKSIELKSVDSSISHNNLGVILALSGDVNAAVKQFEKALQKSNGKLIVAERNLQFCKTLGQNLSAKLEFGKN
jgi:tetratricopeptide (TPR) repeat protein